MFFLLAADLSESTQGGLLFFSRNSKLALFKKELIRQLLVFEKELGENSRDGLEEGFISTALRNLKNVVYVFISNSKQLIINKIVEKEKIPEIVLNIIANSSRNEALSGKYYLSRGILNPLKEGNAYVRIFNHAIDKLVGINVHSEEEGQEQKRLLRRQVSEFGF